MINLLFWCQRRRHLQLAIGSFDDWHKNQPNLLKYIAIFIICNNFIRNFTKKCRRHSVLLLRQLPETFIFLPFQPFVLYTIIPQITAITMPGITNFTFRQITASVTKEAAELLNIPVKKLHKMFTRFILKSSL